MIDQTAISVKVVVVGISLSNQNFFKYFVNRRSTVTAPKTTMILPTAYNRRSTDDSTAFILKARVSTAILSFSILHWVRVDVVRTPDGANLGTKSFGTNM